MTAPAVELYVYWRTNAANAAAATAALHAWQQALQIEQPGLQARLLQRADDTAAELTLMETYSREGGVDPALQQRIVDNGDAVSAPWRHGPRHVEVFIPA